MRKAMARKLVLRGERKKYLQEIKTLEWATEEEISAWQAERLEAVLKDAIENVPYYRERIAGDYPAGNYPVGISLKDFPVLTRNEIKNHRDELIVPSRIKKNTLEDTTSGTTSVPISFLLDLDHRDRGAIQKVFFNEWAGLYPGDSMIKFWGVFPSKTIKKKVRNALSHWIRNMTLVSSLNMRAEQQETFAKKIERMNPKLILAYANSFTEFAWYLERNKIALNYKGNIMTSTSSLTPEKRAAIEQVVSGQIFDRYGSREMIDFACDCDHHEGLHVSPYMHVVEILDENDKACLPGVMGRVVVTQLFNPVMPLIRYEIGDYATWAKVPCSCGRNWPMLKQVDGRAISVFKHRDDGRVSSYYFVYYVNQIIGEKKIIRQQIIQEEYNRFTVRLVMLDPAGWMNREENRLSLEKLIGELIGEPAIIDFDVVTEIPNQPSGKYLQTICRIEG